MSRIYDLIALYCPTGVPYKTLGELGKFFGGLTGKKKDDFSDGNEKFITYKNVYSNPALQVDVEDRVKILSGEKQRTLKYGDIIFTGSSETPDECGISSVVTAKTDEKLYLNSFCFFFRFDDRNIILPDFAKHLFRSSNLRYQISKTASGVTRFNVSKKLMEKVKIPVPPLEVQREIVHILDSFTLLTAELTAELTARKKQYEFYRNKLLTFGNDTLECRLKDICDIFLGLTATPNYTDAGVKFISAQNTSNDFLDLSNVKYISETDFESTTSNAKPQRGDLLFTRVGSNLGHPVIVETDEKLCIFVSLGYLRVRNKKQVVIGYLKHWMNTDLFWSQVRKNVHGAAKVNLNTGWLKEFRISLPPLETQERIVHVLDNFEAICTDLNIGLPAEIEARQKQYEYYRDLLLTFAETGSMLMTDRTESN